MNKDVIQYVDKGNWVRKTEFSRSWSVKDSLSKQIEDDEEPTAESHISLSGQRYVFVSDQSYLHSGASAFVCSH
jgi:hypothetical protein